MVGKLRDLPPGRSRSVRAGNRRVALFNESGALYAVDEPCPHMRADLSNGSLSGGVLTCAWHEWRFDIRTGEGLTRRWARLRTHRLFRDGEDLVLEIEDPPPPPPEEPDLPPPERTEP